MTCWTRTTLYAGVRAALVTSVFVTALLLGKAIAAGHDACHAAGDEPCAVCLLAKAPFCSPEAGSSALPAPAIQHRSVSLPVSRPFRRPLISVTARGPPLEML